MLRGRKVRVWAGLFEWAEWPSELRPGATAGANSPHSEFGWLRGAPIPVPLGVGDSASAGCR
ncbi:hypothetical protein SLNWT_2943 [Streptomyces albus]|uniref:Uncharacterized protein n=1 Tax=Streptomyces albus (strain ATCC 21838 / DSM 41398 / FERM P-419 / JCM 4703 / NBRC 107858) TaxID=1081613 RepID=A0A0B5EP47_STRA4|nr:hypothetical protein SLNWT_2943 [Streptomyces albus]AOU77633.1 hypothetical protein SLNHY_2942 [Streptomyces albus]AYN33399.1 hypothetical protein DUI70_2898 [Streptomyces albus]